jgi:tRNA G18 (ribose-2'-O)-methylase SpoU
VHIVGRRRWNRRGAMVTDRYQHLRHHDTIAGFARWAERADLPVIGIDILDDARPLDTFELPERCVLLFGQEGPGLSSEARAASREICSIRQFGSTRSINAGVASGIAMYEWIRHHGDLTDSNPRGKREDTAHT